MSGYRGEDDGDERGALHGNLFGRAEHDAARIFRQHCDGEDPRARQAAEDWNRRFGREGYEGSYAVDASYRRYRDRHLAELDRDYDDWCRSQAEGFHRDFEDWRRRRQRPASNQPGGAETIAADRAADALVLSEDNIVPGQRGSTRR